jgi:protein SCO1
MLFPPVHSADRHCRPPGLLQRLTVWGVAAAFMLGGLASCAKRDGGGAAKNPAEERYPLTGEILEIDSQQNVLVVKHDEIKGYMPAMTMEFPVTAGDVAIARPGQRIRAELVAKGGGEFTLEKIWVEDPKARAVVESATNALVQDTVAKGNRAYREVGEQAPSFALYDQEGRVVESTRFRGKRVMLNFIFTRCPIPTMCPAAVARFQETQRLAREAGLKDFELVSITLDPAYDTPGVLKTYAITRGIDTSNFTLLTGPENAIKSLLSTFGVLASFQGDLLNHTLATVLIDENGKIIHRADGSRWEPQEFLGKLKP